MGSESESMNIELNAWQALFAFALLNGFAILPLEEILNHSKRVVRVALVPFYTALLQEFYLFNH